MIEDNNEIVKDAPEVEISAPEPQSLREQIVQARDKAIEKEVDDKPVVEKAPKQDKQVKDKKVAADNKAPDAIEEKPEPEIPMPRSYGKAVEQAWKTIPKELKNELNRREQSFHRELTKQDEDRSAGKQFKDIVSPYMAQIRAEGGNPFEAVQNFFNVSHILRNGTPQQKAKILFDTARQFGVDINQMQQEQPNVDPVVNQALQRVQALEQQLQSQQMTVKQQEEAQMIELVNTFHSDADNYPHFAQVEQEMLALLQGNMFRDEKPVDRLKKVYDYAVHANPQTRSILEQRAMSQFQEKRVAEQKAKADAARKAGSSIRGKPGIMAMPSNSASGNLREQLQANLQAAREL